VASREARDRAACSSSALMPCGVRCASCGDQHELGPGGFVLLADNLFKDGTAQVFVVVFLGTRSCMAMLHVHAMCQMLHQVAPPGVCAWRCVCTGHSITSTLHS